jgi:hypothetical protein
MPSRNYTFEDEATHDHDDDAAWQESYFFCWYDLDSDVGGIQRVGHEPNNDNTSNFWNALFTGDGYQYRNDAREQPRNPDDRGERYLQSSGQRITYGGGEDNKVEFEDGETKVDLRFEDFYPICEAWEQGRGGKIEERVCITHYESSGRVTGTVEMGDRHFDVDGLYHRDHSWGPRDWERINGHRWCVGTAGPELSVSGTVMFGPNDLVSGGYVVRDGERFRAEEIDYVVGLNPDNVTVRSAEVTFMLENDETIILDCEPLGGAMLGHSDFLEADQLSRFTVRDEDITGIVNIEVSTNHRLHNRPVVLAMDAALEPGFSQRRGRRVSLSEAVG